MNERIRELAKQAENYADDKLQMPGEYHPDWYDIRDEKFAQLIAQECIDTIQNKSMNSGDEWEDGLRIAEGAIREHFGVK